jgi:hypothetical protein
MLKVWMHAGIFMIRICSDFFCLLVKYTMEVDRMLHRDFGLGMKSTYWMERGPKFTLFDTQSNLTQLTLQFLQISEVHTIVLSCSLTPSGAEYIIRVCRVTARIN